ncbi:AraC family transcriptional regulator [Megamonas hypermegale]|uniref:AraC family transcriptional regulator n=1 Tax=Megamonas hypermegale TaxID=158847 RepID=UPI0025A4AF93|nr:AraC family transcriptional regulator [Megamonas hypermegale]MDM8144289.1 AraC family transcriptional regulator [Megamonas hypermegale]
MENRGIHDFFDNTNTLSRAMTLYYGGWEVCEPLHTFGPAIRQHYLLHYVTRGKGKLWIGEAKNTCYEIGANTIFLIKPGVVTTYAADKNEPWEYCWICIDGYEVSRILRDCGFNNDSPLFFDKSGGRVQSAIVNFVFSYRRNKHNEYTLLSRLYNFFAQMKRQYKRTNIKSVYVEQAIDYIYENYNKNITIGDMANHLNIDRTYLYRLFKRECNVSPQKYLLNFRLRVAVNKLENTQKSIMEIAEECGFNNVSLFCHQFKKVYSDTPLNYRKYPRSDIQI